MDPAVQAGLRRLAAMIEVGAAIVCLLLFSQTLAVFFDPTLTSDEQPLLRLLWYPVYLFALAAALIRPLRSARYVAFNVLALAPVAVAVASTMWSIEPDITFRRTVALAFTTLFGLYLASRFSWRDLILLLAVVFGVLALASQFWIVAIPSRGIMSVEFPGAWQGVFPQKNELGSMMSRGALVFGALLALYPDLRRRAWVWGGLTLCVFLVLMSTSKTSLLALLSIPTVMISVALLRRDALSALAYVALVGLGATILGGLMIWNLGMFFELLGKDPTLTGRTDIWEALLRSISDKPWLGYGYDVFWRGEYGPAYWVRVATEWKVPSAHNGWLETALSIGVIGLAVAVVYVAAGAFAGFLSIWTRREALFALPYVVLTLIFSVSESIILQRNNLAWVMFVAIIGKLFAEPAWARETARETPANDRARAALTPINTAKPCESGRLARRVKEPLTLFRVTLRPGASMIDLSADLAGLAAGLDRTRPADGRGRVIMFTSPRGGTGVSLLSREFARMMARRAPRGVWLFDLDLSRNEHFGAFTGADARRRYGPIGPALDATLGEDPFWRVASGEAKPGARPETIPALLTLHRVGGTRLFVSRFHPELLSQGRRVNIRAAHNYWEKLRDTVELAVIDAPATERSFAGRPLYGEADAVVIVVDDSEEAIREAEYLAESVRDRGGMPAGVIVNMAEPDAAPEPARRAS